MSNELSKVEKFAELESIVGQYLKLADKGIIKLLCAATIANRLSDLDPTWLFVVSSSSGGKSELLLALSHARGMMQKDDLTSKTFVSGAKTGTGKSASLLDRIEPDTIMVVKDLTVLLKKDHRESDAIFSQLRMIYDGSFSKSFGTGEDVDIPVRMGLIAGVTSEIEDHQADEAAVGQRAVKYYMRQPEEEDIDELTAEMLRGRKDKSKREMIGEAFRSFLDDNDWSMPEDFGELPRELRMDLAVLSHMASKARSSIKREQFDKNKTIRRINLPEMPFRFAKQLGNLANAMIIMNGGELTGLDQKILYQVGLDSIPAERKKAMIAATKFSEVYIDALAVEMGLPSESAQMQVEDLVGQKVMTKYNGINGKLVYKLKDKWRHIMAKFENIEITDNVLTIEEESPLPPDPLNNLVEDAQMLQQIGF